MARQLTLDLDRPPARVAAPTGYVCVRDHRMAELPAGRTCACGAWTMPAIAWDLPDWLEEWLSE